MDSFPGPSQPIKNSTTIAIRFWRLWIQFDGLDIGIDGALKVVEVEIGVGQRFLQIRAVWNFQRRFREDVDGIRALVLLTGVVCLPQRIGDLLHARK